MPKYVVFDDLILLLSGSEVTGQPRHLILIILKQKQMDYSVGFELGLMSGSKALGALFQSQPLFLFSSFQK